MLNKVIFQGRLTRDIEVRDAGGFQLADFSIAWSEKYKEIEKVCFLNCKAWGGTATFLEKYFKKGQEILIEGNLITESWEKEGQKQSRLVCNVEKVNFCGSKSTETASVNKKDDGFMNIPESLEDEELPFT